MRAHGGERQTCHAGRAYVGSFTGEREGRKGEEKTETGEEKKRRDRKSSACPFIRAGGKSDLEWEELVS